LIGLSLLGLIVYFYTSLGISVKNIIAMVSVGAITNRPFILKINSPNMTVDGKVQKVDGDRGTTPILRSSRTLVPIRAIVEAMGGKVGWEARSRTVSLAANGQSVEMNINNKNFKANGGAKTMDTAPMIENARTYVPLRFSAENLNCQVDWINSTKENKKNSRKGNFPCDYFSYYKPLSIYLESFLPTEKIGNFSSGTNRGW